MDNSEKILNEKLKQKENVWLWIKKNPERSFSILIAGELFRFISGFFYATGAIVAWKFFN